MKTRALTISAVLGAASAALALAPASALRAAAPDDRRLGVMTHFAHGWEPVWIPVVAQASIPTVRDELYWQAVETQKGRFAFPEGYDRYMAELKRHGIEPLIVLSFENKNYDGGETPHSEAAIAAYARYAVEVLRRYGDQIRAVEIWNEYNGSFCKGPATGDRAGTYLRMLRAAYEAIKRERPDVIVVGGGTSGIPLPYWTSLLTGGALDCMDAISVHPYRYEQAPEGIEQDIAELQALVEKYGRGRPPKPIWVTETGWFTKAARAPGDLEINDVTQAKFLVRGQALLLSAGVERIYWYLLRDQTDLAMGLFRHDAARTPKPAAIAMTTLIRQLRGAKFVRREPTAAGLWSLVFARPSGEEVRVMWSLQPTVLGVKGVRSAVDLRGEAVAEVTPLKLDDAPLFVTGPLTGLPAAPTAERPVLTDSVRDFSSLQGFKGWSYGVFAGSATTLVPLPRFNTTDWTQAWAGPQPYLTVSARDQHPSVENNLSLSAVRRWESGLRGTVRITGRFRCGTLGDGVGVGIFVDGAPRFRKAIGGAGGNPVEEAFDFVEPVQPGTRIDFAVDPGPAADINHDATRVSVTISREEP